jgi:broad specificity phosphatase PhoE
MPSEGIQGDEWDAYVTLPRATGTNVGSPTGRESYGDGGLVVVAGVAPGQGGRESRPQGEGDQGSCAPLGLPTWSDKLVGEVVRLLLEAYYEPAFSDRSHGFRPGRGCHTALREVANTWTGTTWFIEGDIADCFGSFDHQVMVSTLAEKIHDNRFLRLLRNMLTAGYLQDWVWGATLSGVPQGGTTTPPTQWATRAIVTLRVGVGVVVSGGGGVFVDGDAVPDGDLLGSDEDVFDEQAQDALAFGDGGGVRSAVEVGEEAFEVVGELEVDLAVGELGVEGVDLGAQAGLAAAQVRHPVTQFVDGDELLLERLDHAGDCRGGFGEAGFQAFALVGDRVAGPGGVQPPVDLGADQARVGGADPGGDGTPLPVAARAQWRRRFPAGGGRLGGHSGCLGLTEQGRAQAAALGDRLRGGELGPVATVVTSRLRRAWETAEILAPALGVPAPDRRCDLCDVHWGELDGESAAAYRAPDTIYDSVAARGESWLDFMLRSRRVLRGLAAEFAGRTVLVVTHAGFIKSSLHTAHLAPGDAE